MKKVSASNAKNNFGGLLDDVASAGRVDIIKHGRLVAVMLAPREFQRMSEPGLAAGARGSPAKHMIPAHLARNARRMRAPAAYDEE